MDATLLAPRPAFTDENLEDSGPVFIEDRANHGHHDDRGDRGDHDDHDDPSVTHTMKAPPRRTVSSTADISLIEAKELVPAAADVGFGRGFARGFQAPPHTSANEGDGAIDDGIAFDEGYAPATEVLRLAFSDPGGDSVTPAEPNLPAGLAELADLPDLPDPLPDVVDPVEVKKWRTGGGERPPLPPEAQVEPASLGRGGMVQLPAQPGAATRVDAVELRAAPVRAAALDVDELRRTLEEAEKLLRTVKNQASSLDLDLVAPAARGMNAQVAAALHRLGEALAMLGR